MARENQFSHYFFSSESILDALPARDRVLFERHLRLKKIPKGRTLFEEGSHPRTVFILKRGRVKIFQRNPDGGQQIVYIYSSGEMFGYRPLLSDDLHPATATTIEECGIYFLSDRAFLELLGKSSVLSNLLLKNLCHEFTVLVNRIANFSQRSAKERIALALLIVNETYRKTENAAPEINLSRADLAAFAGTTSETLARILTRFKAEKLVRTKGRKLFILCADKLKDLIEQ